MLKLFCFAILLLGIQVKEINGCTSETLKTYHFIIKAWTPLQVKVIGTNATTAGAVLDNYHGPDHNRYLFESEFHSCESNDDYISTKVQHSIEGSKYYLADNRDTSGVDVEIDSSKVFSNSSDIRLYRYLGGANVCLTSLRSSNGNYLVPQNGTLVVEYSPNRYEWNTWPYIARGHPVSLGLFTTMFASFSHCGSRKKRQASSGGREVLFGSKHLNRQSSCSGGRFRFQTVSWRLYKGFDANGTIITGTAIVIRRPNSDDYITIAMDEGIVRQSQSFCRGGGNETSGGSSQNRCFKYEPVGMKRYDQVRRSLNSTFSTLDIADQHTVDERFFEVRQNGVTTRLRSTSDQGKYLAILNKGNNEYSLIVTPLTTFFRKELEFDFQMDVPDFHTTIPVAELPEIPCPASKENIWRPQQNLFRCSTN